MCLFTSNSVQVHVPACSPSAPAEHVTNRIGSNLYLMVFGLQRKGLLVWLWSWGAVWRRGIEERGNKGWGRLAGRSGGWGAFWDEGRGREAL